MMNERSSPGATLAAMLALAALALPPSAGAAGQEGMVVVRDRESGQLRPPTPAELRALRAQQKAMAPPAAISPSVQRTDGTRHLHLGERGMVYSVHSNDAAGRETNGCTSGDDAVHAAVEQPAHGAPTREHGHDRE